MFGEKISWDDVAGLHSAKQALQESLIMPTEDKRKGILLYGPPGVGKTYLAKAVATEAQSFFQISYPKWLSESEKQFKEIFSLGRTCKPAIIYVDEIGSLFSTCNDSENARRIRTEFLVLMNDIRKDMEGVLVLGTTNTPWSLDPAIRRRFEKRIYIPLPEEGARYTMFKNYLGDIHCTLTQEDFHELARKTEGYSSSDIVVVAREATMQPVRIVQQATHFKKVVDKDRHNPDQLHEYWQPCSPDDPQGDPNTLMNFCNGDLLLPPVSMIHLLQALKRIHPSVTQHDLDKYIQWTKDFGQEG